MKNSRLLIGSLIALLIVISGLFTGYVYRDYKNKTPTSPISVGVTTKTSPNNTVYDVSPPSRGEAILEKVSVPIKPFNNMAFIPLSPQEALSIQIGQKALLYNADGMILEILGEVTAVTPVTLNDEKRMNIAMVLNADKAHPSDKATQAEIILKRANDAQRLPLSAIVKEDDGKAYLWEVIKNEDGTKNTTKKPATIITQNYDFVVVEPQNSVSNVFVLNPDNALVDGEKINTREILYNGPGPTEDTRIAYLVDQRTPRSATDPYRGPAMVAPCEMQMDDAGGNVQAGETSSCSQSTETEGTENSSTSCDTPTDALQDFINKVRQETPTAP